MVYIYGIYVYMFAAPYLFLKLQEVFKTPIWCPDVSF